MRGYGKAQLDRIDVELKEAVCDALINTLVDRVSGTDERGRVLYGRSPRRGIVAGQLLPRFGPAGEDETSDIRIAALGLDFVVATDADATIEVTPRFSVYVRVLPGWDDLASGGGELEFDFRLQPAIQQQIDDAIRSARPGALQAAGVDRPDWRSMDEASRHQVRQRRAEVLGEVRATAYAVHGIRLEVSDEEQPPPDDPLPVPADPNDSGGADGVPAAPPMARLIREGRSIPFHLIDPAPLPGKWRRLDLALPTLCISTALSDDSLATTLDQYNSTLRTAVDQSLEDWLAAGGSSEVWRDVRVAPGDARNRDSWERLVAAVAAAPIDRARVFPGIDQVHLRIDRQRDFLDFARTSYRILLDNHSAESTPREASVRCNTIFGTSLVVELPIAAHRQLRLDRVEPSYRFRHYLEYPAIGLNCGIEAHRTDVSLLLSTTPAPRFPQPRIVPRRINVPFEFAILQDSTFDAECLLELPRSYAAWIDAQEPHLRREAAAGLEPEEAARELARLERDLGAQRAEARYIRRGIELLIESKQAADRLAATGAGDRNTLEMRAAPWRAWVMTNEAFARRNSDEPSRGWHLFQMAFVFAHVSVFASRMPEWRDSYDPLLDEDSASLLYFPTGGGKSEAFYGTLLFALFLDRLRGKNRGITALIRYPLRLLTLQQAQRLLKLLVHAEVVRQRHRVGTWPFEIGFWVGNANTPNNYREIRAEVPLFGDPRHADDSRLDASVGNEEERTRARRYVEARDQYNKIPDCPMCGRSTGLRRDERDGLKGKRVAIVCFNDACEWNRLHNGVHPLPFLLTDDAIYARAPAIVLGTVDKLAMLGQHTNTVSRVLGMFGLARWVDPCGNLDTPRREEDLRDGPAAAGCRPVYPAYAGGDRLFHDPFPSIIVQDEAHLLEESLGTFSGLFDTLLETVLGTIAETAGEELAAARRWTGDSWGLVRMPKIIAATATISAPERQVETLYQRRPLRFPSPGPDIYRSFFAEPAMPPADNPARRELASSLPAHLSPEATAPWMRLYVSLMTNDATHTVTTVGVLAAFHGIITELWDRLLSPAARANAISGIRAAISSGDGGEWRRAALDRAVAENRSADIMALIDLHRIALAYVTNKKGGDQIIDALSSAVEQQHRRLGRPHTPFASRLISGGVDMKEIQQVMADAERSFDGTSYPDIGETVRSIVATSAISHGVDVDRFNSMFFAGLPSDIAEYIQASSRVGRTHVGFVMLLPTPQNRRDRYVIETHDVFHRFLERMIAPLAVERWAENAIRRTLASLVQAWAMLQEAREFLGLGDDRKSTVGQMDQVGRLGALSRHHRIRYHDSLGEFVLRAIGFAGRGAEQLGSPAYEEHYRAVVDREVADFWRDIESRTTNAHLHEYWKDFPIFKPPMTSLRDVDEAGHIVAAVRDPRATTATSNVDLNQLISVMRMIRSQRGGGSELDYDGGADG